MKKSDFLKLKPMLLKQIYKPFNDKNYLFEIKFDGIRALIFINESEIIIKSRRNIILNNVFPELLEIKNTLKGTYILDGEIVLFDKNIPSFSKLQERTRLKNEHKINFMRDNFPVTFVCFDILYKNKDLTKLPLLNRKKILDKISDTKFFIKSLYIETNGINLFNLIKKENLEGIVAKEKNSAYLYNERVNSWLKIKNFKLKTFYIYGYIDNSKNYVITLILGEKINNKNYFVGKVILGKKDKLYNKLKKEVLYKNILENYKDNNTFYIKPKYTIKVQYMERTKNNYLRGACIKK